jgi:hypothetical protein
VSSLFSSQSWGKVVISKVGAGSTTNMISIRGELMVAAKAPKAPTLEVVLMAC